MDGRDIPAEVKRWLENQEYYYFSQGPVLLYEVTGVGLRSFLLNFVLVLEVFFLILCRLYK